MSRPVNRRSVLRLAGAGTAVGLGAVAVGLEPGWAGAAAAKKKGKKGKPSLDASADQIVASVQQPTFPAATFPVTSYGAAGDGSTDCTAAFQAAITDCNSKGGGHVTVPAGTFLTGTIRLLSNVDLHLEQGATVKFSQDPAAYLPAVYTRWQGIELMNYSPFIYCYGQQNVAVTGQGTLDGQADASHWWNWKTQGLEDPDFTALQQQAAAGTPVSQRLYGAGHHLPPPMIQPYATDGVLIEGVTVINSPFWHLNPVLCKNVTVSGVTTTSSGPNTDGCDPECCDGVVIENVTFSTGDDCIAIKSGRDADGRRVGVPCQNVVIQNCVFDRGYGAITIGSEMSGGVRNVYARDLTMTATKLQCGYRLKSNSLRGGYILNSNVYRVKAGNFTQTLLDVEGTYNSVTGHYPPHVASITVGQWTAASCAAVWRIAGTSAKDPAGPVTISGVAVAKTRRRSSAVHVTGLHVSGVTVGGKPYR